jgi:hypothetical protein
MGIACFVSTRRLGFALKPLYPNRMIIVADQDTPAPEVPEMDTCGDFAAFVQTDIIRLRDNGVSEARYYEGDMAAAVSIREAGALVEIFRIESTPKPQ